MGKSFAVSALSGHYEGSVPFILDMNLIFPGDGTMNFDQNVKVAHQEIKCPTEKIAETATAVTFPNIANTGDCMGDALRGQKKDVSKFTISINADGTLTFHSDGWPDLKLTKKTSFHCGVKFSLAFDIRQQMSPFEIDILTIIGRGVSLSLGCPRDPRDCIFVSYHPPRWNLGVLSVIKIVYATHDPCSAPRFCQGS